MQAASHRLHSGTWVCSPKPPLPPATVVERSVRYQLMGLEYRSEGAWEWLVPRDRHGAVTGRVRDKVMLQALTSTAAASDPALPQPVTRHCHWIATAMPRHT